MESSSGVTKDGENEEIIWATGNSGKGLEAAAWSFVRAVEVFEYAKFERGLDVFSVYQGLVNIAMLIQIILMLIRRKNMPLIKLLALVAYTSSCYWFFQTDEFKLKIGFWVWHFSILGFSIFNIIASKDTKKKREAIKEVKIDKSIEQEIVNIL